MAFPIYTTKPRSDRERLGRLMARRGALAARLLRFPEPPRYLSARELDTWEDVRAAFSGTGAVGSDQFAAVESLVVALSNGDRLREALSRVPIYERHARCALITAIDAEDATVLRVLEFLGVTDAMRVYLATRSLRALTRTRIDLAVNRRGRHARPTA
jgi:hypothetical protein